MKLRLLSKMLLGILLPAILGFFVLSFTANYLASEAMTSQIKETLNQLITGQAEELTNLGMSLQDIAKNSAELRRAQSYLQALANKDKRAAEQAQAGALTALEEIKRNFTWVTDAGYIDSQGIVAVHTVTGFAGSSLADRSYFTSAMQGQNANTTVFSRATNDVRAIFSSPVRVEGKIVGVAYLTVKLSDISKITTDNVRIGRSGRAVVFDAQGIRIMDADPAQVGQNQKNIPWVADVLAGKGNGRLVHTSPDGHARLSYYAKVPSMGWIVVLSANQEDVLAPVRAMTQTALLLAFGVSALVGLIVFLFARRLSHILQGGAKFAGFVAQGNLVLSPEQRALLERDSSRGDEIGELASAIGTMTQNIAIMVGKAETKSREAEQASAEARLAREAAEEATARAERAKREGMLAAAGQLEGAVAVISSASTELEAQIAQSENGASEQAARSTETATAMQEMNCTVLEVARNAGEASKASATTRQKAEAGAEVVAQAVASIKLVQSQSLALKEDMADLDQNAQAINQIMSVISDIADQTNLLALNAAIEAARAGDAGRGFAVVADEVRKLAEKTMASTADVGKAIRAIQQSASKSITQVEEAVLTIEKATSLAGQSGDALKEIVSMVDGSADQVRAIATAAEQQSSSSEEINQSISQINNIALETAKAMHEASHAVSELAEQAHVLHRLISDMKQG